MLSLKELRQLCSSLPLATFCRQLGPFALIQQPRHVSTTDQSQQRTEIAPSKDVSLAMAALLFAFDDLLVATLPPLSGVDSISVGRLPDCELIVDDTTVSKKHAVLRWNATEQAASVQDEGSTNGTYVNSSLIARREVQLRDGDLIAFGDVAFWFLLTGTLHARLREGAARVGANSG